ncbi:MAG: tRNA 2-thiouridine(34) synthase MnmA [Phycisphaerae bacterium]|nr:tRNA 2-thiouridine(34) synthase MnmA [Phycisphaerae bacterium]
MGQNREKVVVAMSGGVDSSVAAALLVEQGYEVVGLFMRVGSHAGERQQARGNGQQERTCDVRIENDSTAPISLAPSTTNIEDVRQGTHPTKNAAQETPAGRERRGCCSAADAGDARFVAGKLGVPFYALNFEADFARIIDHFAAEYAAGRTPNPCVTCNDQLKFGKLLDYADAVGAKYVATGHYARIGERAGRRVLCRARDARKDQSYVLFGVRRPVLDRVIFPLGDLIKDDVRRIAAEHGFPNADKPDSVEICFVPNDDYTEVVRARRPEAFVPGEVVDPTGKVIGRHEGIGNYTIGQRRGLGIAAGRPVYVTALNVLSNTVTLGDAEHLHSPSLIAERCNFLVDIHDLQDFPRDANGGFRAAVKIRYLHTAAPATVHPLEGGRARVVFDEPQRAVTPGQAAVFYDGDVVLGGGWIEREE